MQVHVCAKRSVRLLVAGGLAHGLLLLNSNGIDVALTSTKLQLRAVGGVLDLYFFTGPTPMEVLSQLTSVVGRPLLPPYWSLGLMNSKCGTRSDASCSPLKRTVLRSTSARWQRVCMAGLEPYNTNNQGPGHGMRCGISGQSAKTCQK